VERLSTDGYIDILDRVLDIIDAWMRVALGGIDVIEVESRMVVASIDTYLTRAPALTGFRLVSPARSVKVAPPTRKPAA
jgi:hypothetical protein